MSSDSSEMSAGSDLLVCSALVTNVLLLVFTYQPILTSGSDVITVTFPLNPLCFLGVPAVRADPNEADHPSAKRLVCQDTNDKNVSRFALTLLLTLSHKGREICFCSSAQTGSTVLLELAQSARYLMRRLRRSFELC